MMTSTLDAWGEYLEARYSPATVRAYTDELRRFTASHPQLLDVQSQDVSQFVTQYGKAAAAATVLRSLSALRAFYDWAIREGLMTESPLANVRGPKGGKRKLPRVLDDGDIDLLLQAEISARDRLLILIMLYAGLRVSEVSRLTWSSIQWSADGSASLTVLGKGGKERLVPLHRLVVETLKAWRKKRIRNRADHPIFWGYRKKPLSTRAIQKAVLTVGETAGLSRSLTPHMLRHTFATMLLSKGANIRVIQKLLGHASIATTEVYTHVSDQQMAAAIELL